MQDWKQAISLAKFELRNSKKALITLSLVLISFAFAIINSTPIYMEKGFIFFDIFFLIITGMAAIWAKPKEFQMRKEGIQSSVNPYFVMLHQLPIPKAILIKNRFVIYYTYAVPFHTIFLISIYAFSETMRTALTFPQYIAFAIIWLSFGFYWGAMYPVADIGEVYRSSSFKNYLYFLVILIVTFGGLYLLQVFTDNGLVYWTIIAAKKWPLLSSVLSVIAAYIGTVLALRQANRNIEKIDY